MLMYNFVNKGVGNLGGILIFVQQNHFALLCVCIKEGVCQPHLTIILEPLPP